VHESATATLSASGGRGSVSPAMRIGVPKETATGERRVALVPDSIQRLVKAGAEVVVERGAGECAYFSDAAYVQAGAALAESATNVLGSSDVVAKVRKPSLEEAALLRRNALVISLLQANASSDLIARFAERGVSSLSLELVPRIARAQSMDVLSSQSTVAGYKAVLIGAAELARLLPMLTTAAGSLTPAKTFVIGAGVAGLQAIATARRLGAVVSAFDVRAAAREQVQSLGATFVAAEVVSAAAETAGGYAKVQTEDEQARTQQTIRGHIREMDLVITTALVPGQPAPRLITDEAVREMRPGAVIVDLAAESGGNCALTRAGETVVAHGVTILGPTNLPSTVPFHASQMFSRNVLTLLQHLMKGAELSLDREDEITRAMLVTYRGESIRR
jgi:NAD(P) transhydrogenase subunit alpha